jgi:group I intron endonuclease
MLLLLIISVYYHQVSLLITPKGGDTDKPLYSLPMTVEKIYDNFHEQTTQDSIQKDLAGLSGVYAIRHNPSNKMYIGSSVDLRKRFLEHFKGKSSNIHLQRAFKKSGHESFSFIIIEFVPSDISLSPAELDEKKIILVSLEQKYLDLIPGKYNINPTAGSSLGVKRSEATKKLLSKINGLKFLGKTHTEEYKEILRQRISGKKNPMYGKPVTEENKNLISELFSKSIYVYDANTLTLIAKFNKHKDLITEFKVSTKTIVKYKDSGEVFRDKYIISSYPIVEKD